MSWCFDNDEPAAGGTPPPEESLGDFVDGVLGPETVPVAVAVTGPSLEEMLPVRLREVATTIADDYPNISTVGPMEQLYAIAATHKGVLAANHDLHRLVSVLRIRAKMSFEEMLELDRLLRRSLELNSPPDACDNFGWGISCQCELCKKAQAELEVSFGTAAAVPEDPAALDDGVDNIGRLQCELDAARKQVEVQERLLATAFAVKFLPGERLRSSQEAVFQAAKASHIGVDLVANAKDQAEIERLRNELVMANRQIRRLRQGVAKAGRRGHGKID